MRPPASTNSLDVYTAGSRCLAARSTRRLCSLRNLLLGSTIRAPARAAHVREGPGEFVRTSRLDELKGRVRSLIDWCWPQVPASVSNDTDRRIAEQRGNGETDQNVGPSGAAEGHASSCEQYAGVRNDV